MSIYPKEKSFTADDKDLDILLYYYYSTQY
jgi:hypothetical protein